MGISNSIPHPTDEHAKLLGVQRAADMLVLLHGLLADPNGLKNLSSKAVASYSDVNEKHAQLTIEAEDAQAKLDAIAKAQSVLDDQQKTFEESKASSLDEAKIYANKQAAILVEKQKQLADVQYRLDAEQTNINGQLNKLKSLEDFLNHKSDDLDSREQSVAAREDAIAKTKAAL